jgi:CRP-like cAMP-binding protein|tara:strand:+ start:733 stop:1329 length:597 start_codon:yes stop_codon:yes gene_type:complete
VKESKPGQLSKVRVRLPMLLSTHLSGLGHRTLRPSIGEVVIRQDTPAEHVLVVQAGELCVERTEAGGKPRLIATVSPGEMAGEMALMGDQRHSATVTVSRGPAELLEVKADDLLQAAMYDSDLVMELLALSSHRCRQTSRHLTLILESLEALGNSDKATLKRCCEELDQEFDQFFLSNAADRLRELSDRIEQLQAGRH